MFVNIYLIYLWFLENPFCVAVVLIIIMKYGVYMQNKKIVKLNIGAWQTYILGFINLDISPTADISVNLNKDKLSFDDSSVDLIVSYRTLEHIPEYLFDSECYRVLKNGGIFLLGLPYVSLTEYHLVNPYHFHNFNEYSFDFFDENQLKGSAAEENRIAFKKIFHRFHYIGIFNIIPPSDHGVGVIYLMLYEKLILVLLR